MVDVCCPRCAGRVRAGALRAGLSVGRGNCAAKGTGSSRAVFRTPCRTLRSIKYTPAINSTYVRAWPVCCCVARARHRTGQRRRHRARPCGHRPRPGAQARKNHGRKAPWFRMPACSATARAGGGGHHQACLRRRDRPRPSRPRPTMATVAGSGTSEEPPKITSSEPLMTWVPVGLKLLSWPDWKEML